MPDDLVPGFRNEPFNLSLTAVSRHHTISVSNFQSIKVSADDWMVNLLRYLWIAGLINPLNTATNYIFLKTVFISSFSLRKLDFHQVSNTIQVS